VSTNNNSRRIAVVKNIPFTIRYALLVLLTGILLGCQSVPTIHSMQDQSAQFDEYQTFGFYPTLLPQGNEYDSLTFRYIKSAIKSEMLNHGYKYADEPDLWVNFNVNIKDKINITSAPSASLYYHYRRGYGVWGNYPIVDDRITQYTEGTLNIDLIDSSTKRLLWEGVAIGRVSENTYENLEDKINKAIALIFEKLPN
tara:strand:+ start:877 stop:1470 length:594 start_codon:yes stop_codon:yes gene_type:complete